MSYGGPAALVVNKQETDRERRLRLRREEFAKRSGDPSKGGATRAGLVTAYRQDAIKIAAHLAGHGACRGAEVRDATGVARATTMMRDNYYGWFEKVTTGVYDLSDTGRAAVEN